MVTKTHEMRTMTNMCLNLSAFMTLVFKHMCKQAKIVTRMVFMEIIICVKHWRKLSCDTAANNFGTLSQILLIMMPQQRGEGDFTTGDF